MANRGKAERLLWWRGDFVTPGKPPLSTRLSRWWNSEYELDYAPWHHPKPRVVAPGVTITTTYGSHVIAALIYAAYRKVRGVRP